MYRCCIRFLLLAGLVLLASPVAAGAPLQLFIDLTPAGGTLRPPPGTYSGPIILEKPITLDGEHQVTIDGQNEGSVIIVKGDNIIVRNLKIINSGNSHDKVDAGILVSGDKALVENNQIEEVLFGINLMQSNESIIQNNTISSRKVSTELRGESIRLWYSNENRIRNNRIHGTRDFLLTNSAENWISNNHISGSRIGIELIFSPGNDLANNLIEESDTGIVLIYSNDVNIHDNTIRFIRNIGSSALAVKGSSQVRMTRNTVLNCRTGLKANTPTHPENILYLDENRFLYNDVAMYFYGEKGGHIVHGNEFTGNITEVATSAPSSARGNDWLQNRWQNYAGFDQDHNGVGDLPYDMYLYSDRLWMDRPMIKFFRSSPVLDMIDFVERLAPYSAPKLILEDPQPRLND